MTLHINKFVDLIKAQESRGGRDVIMSLQAAKDLHSDITKLLLVVETLREQRDNQKEEVIKVELTGGTF